MRRQKIHRLTIAASLLVLLGACATPCPPSSAPPGPARIANYTCQQAGSAPFTVTFTQGPETAIVEQEGFPTVTLPIQTSGAGFRYAAGGVELSGRAEEARLTRPGGGELICELSSARAAPPPEQPHAQIFDGVAPCGPCGARWMRDF